MFTIKYGVLMWEIFSGGKEPFSDISIFELVSKLKEDLMISPLRYSYVELPTNF